MEPLPERNPAGFWARSAAWSLDAVCLLPLALLLGASPIRAALVQASAAFSALSADMTRLLDAALAQGQIPTARVLSWLQDPRLLASIDQLQSALTLLLILPLLFYAALAGLWSVGFEASAWQATPGKRALGLVVTTAHGGRLSRRQALLRFAAAGVSWLSLNLGHAMAAFAPHLALHDRLSHSRVLAARPGLPLWARAWLGLLATGFLLGSVLAFRWLQGWMLQAAGAA
ncbi:RDD family protein [Thermomonas paludicola]|uniref:RDD family protein n=1 Tax=Thermomonas paludicola TaxID=2884874 RepID=UPI0021153D57|nr:RDD family protein [Thermomonas paludicola]